MGKLILNSICRKCQSRKFEKKGEKLIDLSTLKQHSYKKGKQIIKIEINDLAKSSFYAV